MFHFKKRRLWHGELNEASFTHFIPLTCLHFRQQPLFTLSTISTIYFVFGRGSFMRLISSGTCSFVLRQDTESSHCGTPLSCLHRKANRDDLWDTMRCPGDVWSHLSAGLPPKPCSQGLSPIIASTLPTWLFIPVILSDKADKSSLQGVFIPFCVMTM